jgi:large subunit ribosomal protein L30e
MIDLERIIKSAKKLGKIFFGTKKAAELVSKGRVDAIIVASNCPPRTYHRIKQFTQFSNTSLHVYPGTSIDLGMVCEKPFATSAVAIRNLEPSLLKMLKESNE